MNEKCKICASGRAREIDALLDDGKSLDAIAAKTGVHRSSVYRHSRRCRDEGGNAPGSPTAADRQLLKHWSDLHKKSMKAGNWDAAARALQAISEIQARLAAPPPMASRPSEVRFKVIYENGAPFGETEETTAGRVEKPPRSAQRNDLITRIADYFAVEREAAEFVIAELEKGKENGEWETDFRAHSNQKLLPEPNEGAGDEGNS